LQKSIDSEFRTAIITNHHVIEDCLDESATVTIEDINGVTSDASIVSWDSDNDLAVLATEESIQPLRLSTSPPYPGYWIMAVGSADGFAGSVAFGNVLNTTNTEVLITANISGGNSGGPLVDNLGLVIGTNTYSRIGEQYNGSESLDAMCAKIIDCDSDLYWDWSQS
jgi:serine protease Do